MKQLYHVVGSEDTIRVPLTALEVLNWAPAKLTASERLLLFALIYALRPSRYLEIGTLKGGSALVVAAAMDAADYPGKIVCVDIRPQVDPVHWERIQHRASMVVGNAKNVLPEAKEVAGGSFDFVLIDGDHEEAAVMRDATKAASVLSPGGILLFHDSFCGDVERAVDDFVLRKAGAFIDLGDVTREHTTVVRSDASTANFCGFRLVQHRTGSRLGRAGRQCQALTKAVVKAALRKPWNLARSLARKTGLRR